MREFARVCTMPFGADITHQYERCAIFGYFSRPNDHTAAAPVLSRKTPAWGVAVFAMCGRLSKEEGIFGRALARLNEAGTVLGRCHHVDRFAVKIAGDVLNGDVENGLHGLRRVVGHMRT